MPITSSTTHGKLYMDALKLEEKYMGLVFELKRLIRDEKVAHLIDHPVEFLDKLEKLVTKYGVTDAE